MGLPIPGHFLRERESTRIGSTMPGLCSLLCSSGPLNVRNVKFHLAARSTPSTFVGRGTAELGRHCRSSVPPEEWAQKVEQYQLNALQIGVLWGCERWRWWRNEVLVALSLSVVCAALFAAAGCRILRAEAVAEGWSTWKGCTGAWLWAAPSLIWCTKCDPFAWASCFDYGLKAACVLKRLSK